MMCIAYEIPNYGLFQLPRHVVGYKVIKRDMTNWFRNGRTFQYKFHKVHRTTRTPAFSVLQDEVDARVLASALAAVAEEKPMLVRVQLEEIERFGIWYYYHPHAGRFAFNTYEGRKLTLLNEVDYHEL